MMGHAQQNRRNIDGLCQIERDVLARWDGGMTKRQIARDLGKDVRAIDCILSYLIDTGDQRRAEQAMKAGSSALLTALQKAHP